MTFHRNAEMTEREFCARSCRGDGCRFRNALNSVREPRDQADPWFVKMSWGVKCGGALSLRVSRAKVQWPYPHQLSVPPWLCWAPRKHYNSDGGNLESQFYTGPAATSNNILHYYCSGTWVTDMRQGDDGWRWPRWPSEFLRISRWLRPVLCWLGELSDSGRTEGGESRPGRGTITKMM